MGITLIDTLEPLGNFPVAKSDHIQCGELRLDAVLNASAVEISKKASKEYVDEQIASIPQADVTRAYVDANFAKKNEIPTVPTKTSQLQNDSGFLTQHQSLANYVTTSDSRLSDARPASDVYKWAKSVNKPNYSKGEIGLANVDNTADIDKPISNAVQSALDEKASVSIVEELENTVTANANNISANSARIDSFTRLEEGSTTGDAELEDARIMYNGIVATNAGGAVRKQISDLNSKVDSIATVSKNSLTELTRTPNKYYNSNAGVITTASGNDTIIFDEIVVPAGKYYFKYIYGYFSFYKTNGGNLVKLTLDTSNRWTGEVTFSDVTTLYLTAHKLFIDNSVLSNNAKVAETGENVCDINNDSLGNVISKGVQYIDTANMTDGKYYTNNGGQIGTGNGTGNTILAALNLKAGTYYYKNIYAYFSFIANVGGGLTQISSNQGSNVSGSFTLQYNQTVYISVKTASKYIASLSNMDGIIDMFVGEKHFINPDIMANYSAKSEVERTHKIVVKKDGTGNYTTLKEALSACVGADSMNRYVVEIHSGEYDVLDELGGTTFLNSITASSGNRLGLTVPGYTSIVGVGDVTLLYLPDDSVSNAYTTQDVAPLEVYGNTKIENIKIKAKNCRYCVHDETNNNARYNDSKHEYVNCIFTHLGNKAGTWGSPAAIASGTSSGCSYSYTNCVLSVPNWTPWSMHNNENQKSINVSFDGVVFNGASSEGSIRFGYYKKNTSENSVFFKNCKATSGIKVRKEAADVESDNVWNIYNFTDIAENII